MLDRVVSHSPPSRQSMIHPAAFKPPVETFRRKHRKDPYGSNLREEQTRKGITQYYAFVQERQTQTELMAKKIVELGPSRYYIHTNMAQSHRNRVDQDFKAGLCRNLVCSELVTCGINSQAEFLHIRALDQPHTKGF